VGGRAREAGASVEGLGEYSMVDYGAVILLVVSLL
jgi:hypothetical protein